MRHKADLAVIERRQNLARERHARQKAEETAIEAGMVETATLHELRGTPIERAPQKRGESRKPMRRLTGLQWLKGKKKLTEAQYEAGEKYGAVYRKAKGEAAIKSILNEERGGGGFNLKAVLAEAEQVAQAQAVLRNYRNQLMGEPSLILACDRICGEERTPRECSRNGSEAEAQEALLLAALNMLAATPCRTTTSGEQP